MNIEIRQLTGNVNENNKNIRFHLYAEHKVLATLAQLSPENMDVVYRVLGTEILEKAGLKEEDSCWVYVIGLLDDEDDLFLFQSFQEIVKVNKDIGFSFLGVEEI